MPRTTKEPCVKVATTASHRISKSSSEVQRLIAEAKDFRVTSELKAKQEAEAKAATLKKTTITCLKGKLVKKITAIKPKCPTGYKLKK